MKRKVLFVCTGNTCRSPMAAALMRALAAQRGVDVEVASAGTAAIPGLPATAHAVAALAEQGVDLGDHRSQPLTAELVAAADLVLTMTARHKERVLDLAPDAAGKVFTLAEYAGGDPGDVPDPFGGDLEEYRKTAAALAPMVRAALERLVAGAAPAASPGEGTAAPPGGGADLGRGEGPGGRDPSHGPAEEAEGEP